VDATGSSSKGGQPENLITTLSLNHLKNILIFNILSLLIDISSNSNLSILSAAWREGEKMLT
jgi:hypothetical protein